MTKDQTKELFEVVEANYKSSFFNMNEKEKQIKAATWWNILYPYTKQDCFEALKNWMASNRTAPQPSNIKEELRLINAQMIKKHPVHSNNGLGYTPADALTRTNFQELCIQELAPFLRMSLPEHIKEKLNQKHNHKALEEFITMVWGYISDSDFKVFHIEIVFGKLRGEKFTFKQFMKTLVNVRTECDDLEANPHKFEALKQHFLKTMKPTQEKYKKHTEERLAA